MSTIDRSDRSGAQLRFPGRCARRCARALPLLALAAWVAMAWVPVLDGGRGGGSRLTITSLGEQPIGPETVDLAFALPWIAILVCSLTAWLSHSFTVWAPTTVIVGLVLLVALLAMILDPPLFMWDGQGAQGRWIGGLEVGHPAPGALFWALGGLSLIAAGLCGFGAGRPRRRVSTRPGPRG